VSQTSRSPTHRQRVVTASTSAKLVKNKLEGWNGSSRLFVRSAMQKGGGHQSKRPFTWMKGKETVTDEERKVRHSAVGRRHRPCPPIVQEKPGKKGETNQKQTEEEKKFSTRLGKGNWGILMSRGGEEDQKNDPPLKLGNCQVA